MKKISSDPLSLFICFTLFVILPTETFIFAFLAVLCHEAAHAVMGGLFKMKIREIKIMPVGISILMSPPRSYLCEAAVALSGPFMNALLSVAVLFACGKNELFYISLALCALNLLPLRSLDGGAAIRALMSMIFCEKAAEVMLDIFGIITLAFLYIIAVYVLFYTTENFALIAFTSYMFVFTVIKRDKSFKY